MPVSRQQADKPMLLLHFRSVTCIACVKPCKSLAKAFFSQDFGINASWLGSGSLLSKIPSSSCWNSDMFECWWKRCRAWMQQLRPRCHGLRADSRLLRCSPLRSSCHLHSSNCTWKWRGTPDTILRIGPLMGFHVSPIGSEYHHSLCIEPKVRR